MGEFNWSLHTSPGANAETETETVRSPGRPAMRSPGCRRSWALNSNGSGRRSGGCRVRMPLCYVACRRPWVVVGSVKAVVPPAAWRPDRLAPVCCVPGSQSRDRLRARGADIAGRLRRAPSTVSRELRRERGDRSVGLQYRASTAQSQPRPCGARRSAKLAANGSAEEGYVQDRLAGNEWLRTGCPCGPNVGSWSGRRHGHRQDRHWATAWSPQQIAHRLRKSIPTMTR